MNKQKTSQSNSGVLLVFLRRLVSRHACAQWFLLFFLFFFSVRHQRASTHALRLSDEARGSAAPARRAR
jgi:hypothetical protein